jgi:lysozyme family protein
MNFDEAFEKLIGNEGGYVNDLRDPSGETKHGISKRAHPNEDIKGLTLERAKQIYLTEYWGPAGCESVPPALKFDLFDMAVNSGIIQAVKTLQKTVNETQDGILGPKTLRALTSFTDPLRLAVTFNANRLDFYTLLVNWPYYGKGWARRIANNLRSL